MKEISRFINKLLAKEHLSEEESARAFQIMMCGGATPAQMSALLIAFRMNGESVDEIAGAARAMRAKCLKIEAPEGAIDTCGTGGDASGSYNISTAVAFVVAGAGVPVAKHGNKAVSSRSGSADVLQQLGVNTDIGVDTVQNAIANANICFMMASKFHKAMRHVAPVRQELGVRTIFNILGPLANPAQTSYQLLGVYDKALIEPMAHVLNKLGCQRAWVVHGSDGLDELTTTGTSFVAQLDDGEVTLFEVNPEEVGLERVEIGELKGGDVTRNAIELKKVLSNQGNTAYRDVVLLNAGAALLVANKVSNLQEGIDLARETIKNGDAKQALLKLVEYSNLEMLDQEKCFK